MFTTIDTLFVLFAVLLCAVIIRLRRNRLQHSLLPLPPGPRPIPILGNLQHFPLRPKDARQLTSNYGDIVYLSAFGTPVIILGSHEAAVDLLDKRSTIYSDRNLYAMSELTSFEWLITVIGYGPWWRKVRGAFHRGMGPTAIIPYRNIQHEEVKRHLLRLLEDPKDFYELGRRMIGTTIIRVVYGLDTSGPGMEYVRIAEDAMNVFNVTFQPGRYLVQTFPWMRYIPAWLPGAGFQREFAAARPRVRSMRDVPWEAAVAKKRHGHTVPASFFATQIERIEDGHEDELAAKCAAASAYLGGADTTLSTLQSFMAAMAVYPDVQKRAQKELDAVIGPDRLPTLEDKPFLPFISALVKECLRWRSVVPMSVTHVTTEEDEYRGYRIPKGSVVVSNVWQYSRDPRYYPDPEAFKPERFLNEDGKIHNKVLDPSNVAFGYGRRICPGRFFAEASVFTMLSNILHTFTIEAPKDADGNAIRLDVEMTDGVVSYPEPFECTIKPRHAAAEALIRSSCAELL